MSGPVSCKWTKNKNMVEPETWVCLAIYWTSHVPDLLLLIAVTSMSDLESSLVVKCSEPFDNELLIWELVKHYRMTLIYVKRLRPGNSADKVIGSFDRKKLTEDVERGRKQWRKGVTVRVLLWQVFYVSRVINQSGYRMALSLRWWYTANRGDLTWKK